MTMLPAASPIQNENKKNTNKSTRLVPIRGKDYNAHEKKKTAPNLKAFQKNSGRAQAKNFREQEPETMNPEKKKTPMLRLKQKR